MLESESKWMVQKNVIQIEVTQTQKDKRHLVSLIGSSNSRIFRFVVFSLGEIAEFIKAEKDYLWGVE